MLFKSQPPITTQLPKYTLSLLLFCHPDYLVTIQKLPLGLNITNNAHQRPHPQYQGGWDMALNSGSSFPAPRFITHYQCAIQVIGRNFSIWFLFCSLTIFINTDGHLLWSFPKPRQHYWMLFPTTIFLVTLMKFYTGFCCLLFDVRILVKGILRGTWFQSVRHSPVIQTFGTVRFFQTHCSTFPRLLPSFTVRHFCEFAWIFRLPTSCFSPWLACLPAAVEWWLALNHIMATYWVDLRYHQAAILVFRLLFSY